MKLTRKELEKSIGDSILLISRAKQQGDTGSENRYSEQLKLLELAYVDIIKDRRIVPSYDG
ncbi:MAG TPA: hypothetical protein VH415_03735 [Nitrososphaeraceae archaeon]